MALIQQHGTYVYLLLFLYCVGRSGSLPLFAGFAAQQQALDLPWVLLAVIGGGYLGDELRFFIARRYGDRWAHGRPRIQAWFDKARLLMRHHAVAYMFLYRYPIGIRMVGALPVGLGKMPWAPFSVVNLASALTWGNVLVGVGYLFGGSIESGWGWLTLALMVGFMLWIWFAFKRLAVQNS